MSNRILAIIQFDEVQAFGKYYKDIGIRIKHNTEIIKIGAGDLNDNTHKLRIRKGDTTYGIPLLERDHDDASPILIYDGNQIKALAEIKQ